MATAVSIGTLYCYEESSLEITFEDAIFLGSGKDIDEIKKLSSTGVVEKEIKLMCVRNPGCWYRTGSPGRKQLLWTSVDSKTLVHIPFDDEIV